MTNVTFANKEIANRTELFKEILKDGNKYSSVVLTARTSQSLQPKKNGCPYGKLDEITKLTEYSACVNGIYQDAINRRKEKEGQEANFEAQANWQVKIYDGVNGCIVAKRKEVENGLPLTETYVQLVSNTSKSSDYEIQGRKASEQEVATIKQWRKDGKKDAAKSQGLTEENAVVIRTIKLSGVTSVHANGIKLAI
jgi:hypothetical protein